MKESSKDQNNSPLDPSPIPFAVCLVALAWSGVLLFAGGFTTSIGAGMAFLDWPLSDGSLNPEGWTRQPDQLAEHSHRLAGKVIGLLSILIAVVFKFYEHRPEIRRLAYVLVLLVIFQGLLGGLRVLLDTQNIHTESNWIAQTFAISHAIGAQAVLLLLTSITVLRAPFWLRSESGPSSQSRPSRVRWAGWITLLLIAVSILFGAIMRHSGAALAIPSFPAAAADGSWWPDSSSPAVWVHFLHRTLGIVAAVGIAWHAILLWRDAGCPWQAKALAGAPVVLVLFQIWLGILILETHRNPHVTTIHMLNGAAILATLWASVLCTFRSAGGGEERAPSLSSSRASA